MPPYTKSIISNIHEKRIIFLWNASKFNKWLRCQNYIVELSHTIYSYESINVIYILYVNLVKLSFDPLTIYGDSYTIAIKGIMAFWKTLF